MFLRKGVLKICSKFTREHPCRSVISIKLLFSFIEITLRHVCSPVEELPWNHTSVQHGYSLVTLLHIFRTHFLKNTSGGVLLQHAILYYQGIFLTVAWHNHICHWLYLQGRFLSLIFLSLFGILLSSTPDNIERSAMRVIFVYHFWRFSFKLGDIWGYLISVNFSWCFLGNLIS